MLDEAFQQQTDAALSDLALRPPQPKKQEPAFSMWGVIRGAGKAVPAGVAEGIASSADILGAFGQVQGATDARSGGMFSLPTEEEIKQRNEQTRQMMEQGLDYRSEAGQSFRNVAKDYMPDPVTAHGAEVATAEFMRLATKAVTAGVALGPLPGAVVAGAEEGFTTSDKLADQGVDLTTRTKVGGVTAAVNAFGFALPVAGKTVAQTVGLALAGGPASFMAQQAATRQILENADYSTLADQYDPFDPVGLTLSTVLPLGFGAMAMRGAAKAKAKAVSPDMVDAARTSMLKQNMDQTNPVPARVDLAEAHVQAYARAMEQMSDGRRVEVAELIPADVFRPARLLDVEIERLQARREELTARAGDLAEPGAVRQVREELDALRAARPDDSDSGVRAMAKDIQAADGVSYKQALSRAKDDMAGMMADYEAKVQRLEDAIKRNVESQQATDELNRIGRRLESLQAQRAEMDAPDLRQSPVAEAARMVALGQEPTSAGMGSNFMDWMKRVDSTMDDMRTEMARLRQTGPDQPTQPKPVEQTPQKPKKAQAQQAPDATKNVAGKQSIDTQRAPAGEDSSGRTGSTDADAYVQAEAKRIATENPDMLVMLEGMDKPAPLSEVMARIEQELSEDLAEVPLIKVAAECFIQSGAGAV